jgi:two-component system NtrC family sensor kinase
MRRRTRGASGAPPVSERREPKPPKRLRESRRSGQRTIAEDIPADWLSQLLRIACSLPTDKGTEQVTAALVEAVSALVPSHGIGVSLGAPGKRPRFVRAARAGARLAAATTSERLFPLLGHEHTVAVEHDDDNVWLHIAGDDPAELAEGAPLHAFMQRVAEVLSSALYTTRLVSAKGRESLELKEQVFRSAKLASLGQMAAGVVHELTNPLTSIVGYSDYLRAKAERERSDPADIERLRRIGESAGRILRFSRDLMAYARPSIEPPSPVAIHSVIDLALVFCEPLIRDNIAVERKFAPGLLAVLGVRDQLTQVFVNLFTNACHAMEPEGGALTVETTRAASPTMLRCSVSDTGHGIDKENMARIFEPFFTTKPDGRGTGLGLSIVRNIVLLHGGTVSVEQNAEGGAMFIVELPMSS